MCKNRKQSFRWLCWASFISLPNFLHVLPLWFRSETYDQGGLQEVQLEDGSTAYIQHTVHMPQPSTILAIQADGTIADLQAEATAIDPETISVLEQYNTKVNATLQWDWPAAVWLNSLVSRNNSKTTNMGHYIGQKRSTSRSLLPNKCPQMYKSTVAFFIHFKISSVNPNWFHWYLEGFFLK